MTNSEIAYYLHGMLTVNSKEKEAVAEAVRRLCDAEWIDPEIEIPASEEFVWVLIDGATMSGIQLEHTPAVGSYDPEDGWMLVDYPDIDWFSVLAWMPIVDWEGDEDNAE